MSHSVYLEDCFAVTNSWQQLPTHLRTLAEDLCDRRHGHHREWHQVESLCTEDLRVLRQFVHELEAAGVANARSIGCSLDDELIGRGDQVVLS